MTTCPNPSPVRCEVDQEAAKQILDVARFGLLLFTPRDLRELFCAACALCGCPSDLTLCEVGNG